MKRSKAEREAERFRAEARSMLGQASRVAVVGEGSDPQRQRSEEQRLRARHDPAKPSSCRLCGVTTEPGAAERDGWKVCEPCVALLAGGRAAVYSELVGVEVAVHEVDEVSERTGLLNPTVVFAGLWPTDPGQPERWVHLPSDLEARGQEVLATIRARGMPRPNTFGTGCAFCGVARSSAWTSTGWHKGGRHGPRVASCADCTPWVARSGGHAESWRPNLLAAATGMRRARMGLTYDLKAFWESDAPDEGTEEPWEYLGETRSKLRGMIAKQYPMTITLTDSERRVLALERKFADLEHPPERPKLADV